MAAALLKHHLDEASVAAKVASVGLRPGGRPAWPAATAVMAERGLDLSAHVSRLMDRRIVSTADLVLGMTREHVREVVALVPSAYRRSFTLKEFARRSAAQPRGDRLFSKWLATLTADRDLEDLLGADEIDDVHDPIGGPVSAFRATADDLDGIITRAVSAAWGTASVTGAAG